MERMPAVDRNILRLAVYEMTHGGTPAAVAIDEALELARKFSSEESVQFVNGVLDAIHRGTHLRRRVRCRDLVAKSGFGTSNGKWSACEPQKTGPQMNANEHESSSR